VEVQPPTLRKPPVTLRSDIFGVIAPNGMFSHLALYMHNLFEHQSHKVLSPAHWASQSVETLRAIQLHRHTNSASAH